MRLLLAAFALAMLAGISDANATCTSLDDCIRQDYPGLKQSDIASIRAELARKAKSKRLAKHTSVGATDSKQTVTQVPAQKSGVAPKVAYTKSLNFYLRKDFGDIGLFSKPKDTADAEGAEFSWTQDRKTDDTTWAADGTVAVSYNIVPELLLSTDFRGLAIAAYAGATREIHSTNTTANVDVKKFGLSGEVGWYSPTLKGSHYIRGATAFKQDDIKDATLGHGQLEYLPVWLWDRLHGFVSLGPATLLYSVRPELLAQYDENTDKAKTILFSDQQEAFRVGPEAMLWMKLSAPSSTLSHLFEQTFFTLTYHWWEEAYSG